MPLEVQTYDEGRDIQGVVKKDRSVVVPLTLADCIYEQMRGDGHPTPDGGKVLLRRFPTERGDENTLMFVGAPKQIGELEVPGAQTKAGVILAYGLASALVLLAVGAAALLLVAFSRWLA